MNFVVAPKTKKDALAWAAAHRQDDSDSIVELANSPNRRAPQAAACILALAKLGGENALDAVVSYRPERQHGVAVRGGRFGDTFADPVAKAMAVAWNSFCDPRFGARLFEGVDEVHWANGGRLEHVEGLDAVDGLSFVNVCLTESTSIEPLARSRTLEIVICSGALEDTPLNLEPLRRMLRLRKLGVNARTQDALCLVADCEHLQSATIVLSGEVRLFPLLSERELYYLGWRTDPPTKTDSLRRLAAAVERGVEIVFCNPSHDWRQIPGAAVSDSRHELEITEEKTRLLNSLHNARVGR